MKIKLKASFKFVCYNQDGSVAWRDEIDCDLHQDGNGNTNGGLDNILSVYFASGTQTTTWYLGLVSATGFSQYAAADTMASHAGWTENVSYSDTTRRTWTAGTVASQAVSNSASPASFAINATTSIKGAFLVTNNTKSGTTGTLFATGSFDNQQNMVNGQTLQVTCTISAA